MHEQTYIVKVKVNSKSTSRLETFETSLLVTTMSIQNDHNNVNASIHAIETENVKNIKEGNNINVKIKRELKRGNPFSFELQNSRGETLPFEKII